MIGNKFGLTIQKKSDDEQQRLKPTASVFNTNSDEEGDEKETVDEKFQRKYAVPEKRKDKKILEEAIAEDPTIFDYDGQYEEMQKIRDQKITEQKEADKEKKPKYAHKLIETHKRRELEKLLHDERTYKKEREKEEGEFDDKEVFITSEYRKQIEERESFRKELEESDKMDELRDVKNQSMWQQAFHRKILEDRARVYPDPLNQEIIKKEENIGEEKTENNIIKNENDEVKIELEEENSSDSQSIKEKDDDVMEDDDKEKSQEKIFEKGNNSPTNKIKKSESENEKKGKLLDDTKPSFDNGINEEIRRMEKIRQILCRRNDENALAEARLRYFERRENGEILPPY